MSNAYLTLTKTLTLKKQPSDSEVVKTSKNVLTMMGLNYNLSTQLYKEFYTQTILLKNTKRLNATVNMSYHSTYSNLLFDLALSDC